MFKVALLVQKTRQQPTTTARHWAGPKFTASQKKMVMFSQDSNSENFVNFFFPRWITRSPVMSIA